MIGEIVYTMVKICAAPEVVEDTDRWGRGLGTYSVVNPVGWVEESFWKKIQDFQTYDMAQEVAEIAAKGEMVYLRSTEDAAKVLPRFARLMKITRGMRILEFNLLVEKPGTLSENGDQHYIRYYASLGKPTFKRYTALHEVRVALARLRCAWMNRGNKNEDQRSA